MQTKARPAGVTLLSVLEAVLGVLLLLGFIALTVVSFGLPELFPHMRVIFPVRLFVIAIALFVLGVVEFVLAYGLWRGISWAWIASLVLAVVGIVFAIFSLFVRPGIGEIVSLLVNLVIVYYLIQPRVHAYFGKSSTAK